MAGSRSFQPWWILVFFVSVSMSSSLARPGLQPVPRKGAQSGLPLDSNAERSAFSLARKSPKQRSGLSLASEGERPRHEEYVAMARWLVARNLWGVISTISVHLGGAPFGNVVSFSDGVPGQGSGIPFFYLTALDPTLRDVAADPRVSLTLAEAALGTCGALDPMSPACAKLSLSGQLIRVADPEEEKKAAEALFSKHSEMRYWPKGHDFHFYKLEIRDIFLIDWFGGAQPIALEDYYSAASPNMSIAA